jgi:hypothetical protein
MTERFKTTVADLIMGIKKYSRNHKNQIKAGTIHPHSDQDNLNLQSTLMTKRKMKRIIKSFRKSCRRDLKTRVTFILKRIYFQ